MVSDQIAETTQQLHKCRTELVEANEKLHRNKPHAGVNLKLEDSLNKEIRGLKESLEDQLNLNRVLQQDKVKLEEDLYALTLKQSVQVKEVALQAATEERTRILREQSQKDTKLKNFKDSQLSEVELDRLVGH